MKPCASTKIERQIRETDSPFQLSHEKLMEMGAFLSLAERVGDCSCGEPLLNKDFAKVVNHLHRSGKPLSVATNGQLLDSSNRAALLGKDVELYLSLDAASRESYARYRNNKFDLVVDNLRALCEARPLGTLPNVIAAFIVMKSNLNEFPAFVDLMKDVGVDGIRVTCLNTLPHLMSRVMRRGGSEFRYGEESMTAEEFNRFERDQTMASARSMPCCPIPTSWPKMQCNGPHATNLGRELMPTWAYDVRLQSWAIVARWSTGSAFHGAIPV
jgi:MoaA/NifB/PqqE/SkfB family radical SAM enzyme